MKEDHLLKPAWNVDWAPEPVILVLILEPAYPAPTGMCANLSNIAQDTQPVRCAAIFVPLADYNVSSTRDLLSTQ